MGFLLKEALKAICASNHWCYAVFWKIGHQNPKLLIWEDCHYEQTPCLDLPWIPEVESTELQLEEWERRLVSAETRASQLGIQAGNNIRVLINKMMMGNHVNVLGEGLVGRAAFTGNHQWILSENYLRDGRLREVLNEIHHQFSAGMQTVAVIPVLPHGVVQLGSSLFIMENFGFVNEVQRLIIQLGQVPGALFTIKESFPEIGVLASAGTTVGRHSSEEYNVMNSSSIVTDNSNQQSFSLVNSRQDQCSSVIMHNQDSQKISWCQEPSLGKNLVSSPDTRSLSSTQPAKKTSPFLKSQPKSGVSGAEVISKVSDALLGKQASLNNLGSQVNHQPTCAQLTVNDGLMESNMLLDDVVQNHGISLNASKNPASFLMRADGAMRNSYQGSATGQVPVGVMSNHIGHVPVPYSHFDTNGMNEIQNNKSVLTDVASESRRAIDLTANDLPLEGFHHRHQSIDQMTNRLSSRKELIDKDLFQDLDLRSSHLDESLSLFEHFLGGGNEKRFSEEDESTKSNSDFCLDACPCPPTEGDLFDVLGMDYKHKLLMGSWKRVPAKKSDGKESLGVDALFSVNPKNEHSETSVVSEAVSKSGSFSGAGTDHLLDAVVSRAYSSSKTKADDDVSCRTTLTKISGSSVSSQKPICGQAVMPNKMQLEFLGLQKPQQKAMGSNSFISGSTNDGVVKCSQASSTYGSQISSWVEQGQNLKHNCSVSTGYSKKTDEITKVNRKRLKPGENPRPRPKDRQMIQDRVKELREIVPNGAKCSIDALLERTIKHMLFLQSVTKHADKLQQAEESKITSKEGGVLLKDNFEGGATWAFEVGSQSMVCPIIVEDLDKPRQMLVEMLCEERGFFLEIADIIRGLGLTILKGVMEVRNDKIWARFAVEANRDITRMDIFLSLVRLLDQNVKSSPLLANGLHKDDMMVQHSFCQPSSIPATGRPSGFQ